MPKAMLSASYICHLIRVLEQPRRVDATVSTVGGRRLGHGVTCVYCYGCNHSLLPVHGASTAEKEIGLEASRPPSGCHLGPSEVFKRRNCPTSVHSLYLQVAILPFSYISPFDEDISHTRSRPTYLTSIEPGLLCKHLISKSPKVPER